jgi:hypothetical protein
MTQASKKMDRQPARHPSVVVVGGQKYTVKKLLGEGECSHGTLTSRELWFCLFGERCWRSTVRLEEVVDRNCPTTNRYQKRSKDVG